MDVKIPDETYRIPQDLAVTPTPLNRVIVVGSCLASSWPNVFKAAKPGCAGDFFLFNNATQLPKDPPKPAEEYDFQVIQLPLRSVLPDNLHYQSLDREIQDVAAYEKLFEEATQRLRQFLPAALRWNKEHGMLSFVCNFILPQQNPMGRLLPRYDLRNFVYFVERLNQVLAEELTHYNNAYLFDMDQVIATFGRRQFQDDVLVHLNHGAALSNSDFQHDQNRLERVVEANKIYPTRLQAYTQYMWYEMLAMYRTVRQIDMVKLVVVDIDDTLWRGVVAEDSEPSETVLAGWPLGVIEALRYLKRRGILLAIVSKNDENRIKELWDTLLAKKLKFEDFVTRKINWRPKAENFEQILRETNLLPKNVLFIDDNPVERASIKKAFPGVRVLGPNPYVWRRILLWSAETQVANITTESASRTGMVQAQIERETQRQQLSREDFLASLSLHVTLRQLDGVDHPGFPRALELINKTNQFNTNGKRWTQAECTKAFASGTKFYVFEVEDRFTAYGIVGVVILKDAHIVQFVMSCRVAGMDVEVAVVAEILRVLSKDKATSVDAELVDTELNMLCRDFYERCGFVSTDGHWQRSLSPLLEKPSHVKMTSKSK